MKATRRRNLYQNQKALQDKSIIVTGGSSPFGLFIAQELVQEGAFVLLSCFSEQPYPVFIDLWEPDMPASVVWASGDLRDPGYCRSVVQYALRRFGRLDGVINNSDYEFQTVWSSRAVLPPQSAGHEQASVVENIHRAIAGSMAPGGGVIHTLASEYPQPATQHPPLAGALRPRTRPERLLLENGIRVMVTRPGPAWMLVLADTANRSFIEEQPEEISDLTHYYVDFLAGE